MYNSVIDPPFLLGLYLSENILQHIKPTLHKRLDDSKQVKFYSEQMIHAYSLHLFSICIIKLQYFLHYVVFLHIYYIYWGTFCAVLSASLWSAVFNMYYGTCITWYNSFRNDIFSITSSFSLLFSIGCRWFLMIISNLNL